MEELEEENERKREEAGRETGTERRVRYHRK